MENKKILLPNGCYCSIPKISPLSAYGKNASVKRDWCIQYRFYDPGVLDKAEKIKPIQIIFKGMNEYKTVSERRLVCKELIENELTLLESKGYNPITKLCKPEIITTYDIEPTLPFIKAVELARQKLKCAEATKKDIKSCLKYIEKSAKDLNLHTLQIQQVRRKHMSLVLDNCQKLKSHWSSHIFNHYRAYLMMLFKKLVELEAIESNPVDQYLPKEITENNIRKLATDDQIKTILEHFKDDTAYLRFIHIFFHSGARPVELTRIKACDVDLDKEVFRIKARKGNRTREQEKSIKKIALQYWKDLMHEAKPDQHLFSKGLKPGDKPVTRDYITKKWNREVKNDKTGLGIKIDLYSLKHKNLDEIAAYLSIKEAQKAAGHESPVITMVYAIGEAKRQNERYANVPNILGG